MSDYQDYLTDQLYGPQYSAWDPKLGRNVEAPQGAQTYVAASQPDYRDYSGAVNYVANRPIGADAYVPGTTGITGTPGPTGFNPRDYQVTRERANLNPYDTQSRSASDDASRAFAQAARLIPGTRPDVGTLAGSGQLYNLVSGDPIGESDYQKYGIDPLTLAYAKVAASRPVTPSYADAVAHGLTLTGRGYGLTGAPDPREADLASRFLQGDLGAGQQLAGLRTARIRMHGLSDIQQIAQKYYYPGLMAIPAMAAGPIIGGAWGALTQGAPSHYQNPVAIGVGAASGIAAGWGGAQLGQAMGWGAVPTGMLSGAAGAGARTIGTDAVSGTFDPAAVGRNVAIGGASGAAGGAAGGGPLGAATGSAVGGTLNAAWPTPPRKRNPYVTV